MLGGIPAKSISVANRHLATPNGRVITISEVPRGLVTPDSMRQPRAAVSGTVEEVRHQRSMWTKPAQRLGRARYRFMDMEFWAESGGVYVIDSNPSPTSKRAATDCEQDPHAPIPLSLRAWEKRCRMFTGMLTHYEREHAHTGNVTKEAQYCYNLRTLVEACWIVYRAAKEQGDLTDPAVQEYYRKHVMPVPQNFQVNWSAPQTMQVNGADVLAPDA